MRSLLRSCALALSLVACGPPPAAAPRGVEGRRPAPTDLLTDAWGEDNGVERKRWLAAMHRAAPGTDWRALERENGRRELARRAGLGPEDPLGGRWEELGSSNQAGQTRCVALGAPGPGGLALYVGSANGGLWRSDLRGERWAPLSDDLFGGVDQVVVLPGARGDVLLRRRGPELHVSDDGGRSWTRPVGLDAVVRAHAMVRLDGDDGDDGAAALLLADLSTPAGERTALFGSSAGGRRFRRRWTAPVAGVGDLWVPRGQAERGAAVWLLLNGVLRSSVDGGWSFGAPQVIDARASACELAGSERGSEAGVPRLWAALAVDGEWRLRRSDDGGRSFADLGPLADFWGSLAGTPSDPDVLLYGGVEGHRSVDGGETFARINAWGQYYGDPRSHLHADVRGIQVLPDPRSPGRDLCFFSTDGGTYLSTDHGASVTNLSLDGLGVGQVYATLSSVADPDLVLAGTQDQGFQRGRRQDGAAGGPSTPFEQLLSGDYGYLTSSDGTHQLVYATYPGFVLVQEGERDPNLLYPWVDFPERAQHAWLPPIVADPLDPERFFFLADRLHRYTRRRGPFWSDALHSGTDFAVGGGRFLTAMAFAPSDPSRAYAANDAGLLWRSDDGGVRWSRGRSEGAEWLRPTSIAVHPSEADRAVVAGSGYSGPAVLATDDGGRSWRPLALGLPPTLVHDVAFDGRGEVLYAATEAGAYRCVLAQGTWENLMGRSAPATTYWSVEVAEQAGLVRFGTYGRGIWDFHPAHTASAR